MKLFAFKSKHGGIALNSLNRDKTDLLSDFASVDKFCSHDTAAK